MVAPPLPELRQDLRLHPGAAAWDGSATYMIYDPIAHRFHQIGERAFTLLTAWRSGDADAVRAVASKRLGEAVAPEEVSTLATFLVDAGLAAPTPERAKLLTAAAERDKRSVLTQAAHHYVFFKVPLARPQRFLNATAFLVAPLFTRAALWVWAALTLLGLYLVAQQWDAFIGTFLHVFSWEGLALYAISIIIIKSLHELGHAYAAHRFRVRTPVIGVGFVLLFPILYTDTTDAYRLTSRRQRMIIDAAGVATELWIATIATLVWAAAPEGAVKSAAFLAATAGWITSLLVNASPFMRFDGYYLLADALDAPNLHSRAFAMARWRLREMLFGLKEPPPEPTTPGRRRLLIALGWTTWIYRFLLFLGIALFVYHAVFKALGVILFVLEIYWFIGKPIMSELKEWRARRRSIAASPRSWATALVFIAILALCLTPLPNRVSAPAMLRAAGATEAFVQTPGRIEVIHAVEGRRVSAGDVLLRLTSHDLAQERRVAETELEAVRGRLARLAADAEDRAARLVLLRQEASALEKLDGLTRREETLTVRAPVDGVVRDVALGLVVGGILPAGAPVARIAPDGPRRAVAMIDERALTLIVGQAEGVFIPDDPARPSLRLTLLELAPTAARRLEEPALASTFGGPIAVERDVDGRLAPVTSVFAARFETDAEAEASPEAPPPAAQRGVVLIEAEWNSLAATAVQRIAALALREFGV